jgi:hypothetical protein
VIADVIERQNVGMIQRGYRLGFLFETVQPIALAGKRFWQNLQGHFAAEARISGAILVPWARGMSGRIIAQRNAKSITTSRFTDDEPDFPRSSDGRALTHTP